MKVLLNSMDKVKCFVDTVTKFEADVDLVSGKYNVDAKSIMGIISLNLTRPIEVVIHDADYQAKIGECLKAFEV